MAAGQASLPLAYGLADRRRQRRWVILAAFAIAAACLYGIDRRFGWHDFIWRQARVLYWQRRIVTDRPAAGTLAVSVPIGERTGGLLHVIQGGRGERITAFRGDCGGAPDTAWARFATTLPPATRASLMSGIAEPTTYAGPGLILFVGRLQSPAGDRIVHVSLDSENIGPTYPGVTRQGLTLDGTEVTRRSLTFDVTVLTPATLAQPPRLGSLTYESLLAYDFDPTAPIVPDGWTSADFVIDTIDRGVIDPANPSRFTCDFTTDSGARHRIEGVLSPSGGRVEFRWLDAAAPAAGRPSDAKLIAGPAAGR